MPVGLACMTLQNQTTLKLISFLILVSFCVCSFLDLQHFQYKSQNTMKIMKLMQRSSACSFERSCEKFPWKASGKEEGIMCSFFLFLLCSFLLLAWVICTKSPVRSSDHFFCLVRTPILVHLPSGPCFFCSKDPIGIYWNLYIYIYICIYMYIYILYIYNKFVGSINTRIWGHTHHLCRSILL